MNDFYDNLTMRAMSVEAAVRPRSPLLFEPPAVFFASGHAPRSHWSGVESEVESSANIPFPDRHSRSTERPLQIRAREQGREHSFEEPQQRRVASNTAGSLSAADYPAQNIRAGLDRDNVAARDNRQNDPQFLVEAPAHQESLVRVSPPASLEITEVHWNGDSLADVHRPDQTFLETALQRWRRTESSVEDNRQRDAGRSESSELSGTQVRLSPVPIPVAPHIEETAPVHRRDDDFGTTVAVGRTATPATIRPSLDRYAPLPDRRARTAAAPEQVVNVTIGRVEVRAMPAPASVAPPNNRKPPVMTLDDYLRKNGRSREGVK